MADSIGGRQVFLEACAGSGSEEGRQFLAHFHALTPREKSVVSLQDVCTRASLDATKLVGSMMGRLIMQSNNLAILKAALQRPAMMDHSIANAMSDSDTSFDERKLHFQMAGFIKGEGSHISLTMNQNISGTGISSFEDDAHQSSLAVRSGGQPPAPGTVEPIPLEADSTVIDGESS